MIAPRPTPEDKAPAAQGYRARARFVWFDLETTGLDPEQDCIIQIAAMATGGFPKLEPVSQFEMLVTPSPTGLERLKKTISEGFSSVYDEKKWKIAKTNVFALAAFRSYLQDHATYQKTSKAGKPYYVARLAGHNVARFDIPFLVTQFRKINLFLPAEFHGLDTLQGAIWHSALYEPDAEQQKIKYDLSSLCERFDVHGPLRAHDAIYDIDATIRLARAMAGRMCVWEDQP